MFPFSPLQYVSATERKINREEEGESERKRRREGESPLSRGGAGRLIGLSPRGPRLPAPPPPARLSRRVSRRSCAGAAVEGQGGAAGTQAPRQDTRAPQPGRTPKTRQPGSLSSCPPHADDPGSPWQAQGTRAGRCRQTHAGHTAHTAARTSGRTRTQQAHAEPQVRRDPRTRTASSSAWSFPAGLLLGPGRPALAVPG